MSFFKAIGLTESFTVKFGATPSDILSGLRFIMEDRSSDVYGQKTKRFVGRIEGNGFKLQRRPNMFDVGGQGFVSASGRLKPLGDHVLVETEVGVSTMFKVVACVWTFIVLAIAAFVVSRVESSDDALAVLGIFVGFLLLSFGLQWIFVKITVQSFRNELERNFHKILG
jgi:hypothetical protein